MGEKDAGLLEQLADDRDVPIGQTWHPFGYAGILGIDLAAGKGHEAAEEAQVLGPLDQVDLGGIRCEGQEHTGGRDRVSHAAHSLLFAGRR